MMHRHDREDESELAALQGGQAGPPLPRPLPPSPRETGAPNQEGLADLPRGRLGAREPFPGASARARLRHRLPRPSDTRRRGAHRRPLARLGGGEAEEVRMVRLGTLAGVGGGQDIDRIGECDLRRRAPVHDLLIAFRRLTPALFAEVPRIRILRSSHKRNSRKFAVASYSSTRLQPLDNRPWWRPPAPKRPDLVAVVAPMCIKGLRLVTMQLPEKFSPIALGTNGSSHIRVSWKSTAA